jgi:hypothetical protein
MSRLLHVRWRSLSTLVAWPRNPYSLLSERLLLSPGRSFQRNALDVNDVNGSSGQRLPASHKARRKIAEISSHRHPPAAWDEKRALGLALPGENGKNRQLCVVFSVQHMRRSCA